MRPETATLRLQGCSRHYVRQCRWAEPLCCERRQSALLCAMQGQRKPLPTAQQLTGWCVLFAPESASARSQAGEVEHITCTLHRAMIRGHDSVLMPATSGFSPRQRASKAGRLVTSGLFLRRLLQCAGESRASPECPRAGSEPALSIKADAHTAGLEEAFLSLSTLMTACAEFEEEIEPFKPALCQARRHVLLYCKRGAEQGSIGISNSKCFSDFG